jgi:hypothetical protein
MGPIGSGLPQFGFPRLFAMKNCPFHLWGMNYLQIFVYMILLIVFRMQLRSTKESDCPQAKLKANQERVDITEFAIESQ